MYIIILLDASYSVQSTGSGDFYMCWMSGWSLMAILGLGLLRKPDVGK